MPRKPRIDAPGILYHVIARGIERRPIFLDDTDRQFFLDRLGGLLGETGTPIYSFTLIPNHFHLLLRRGESPIARLMSRLLTGYAMYFNRRHDRTGHLFQNRYKALLCQEDRYFLALVRYINLNPARAGMVKTLDELSRYRYASHCYIMGRQRVEWFDAEPILSMFGTGRGRARKAYAEFIASGPNGEECLDLDGGGLLRTLGSACRYPKQKLAYDERAIGAGAFVEELKELEAKAKDPDNSPKRSAEAILGEVSARLGVPVGQITGKTKERQAVKARRIYAYRLSAETGLSGSDIAKHLSIHPATASKMIRAGSKLS
ncbi:MAG: transposase [Gaiellales bacterium]|nr:MAG: transposase [Gaiellales bacterium]